MFRVEIAETGYAAFSESEGPEVARILRKLADKIEEELRSNTDQGGQLYDLNGNKVGIWEWVE